MIVGSAQKAARCDRICAQPVINVHQVSADEEMFAIQAQDRAINEAVSRNRVGAVGVAAECGRGGGVVESIVTRARRAGVLRPDFGPGDLATLIWAMSKVVAMSAGDDAVWRRHLGFVVDGLRAA
jgi:hypothetical protein